MSGRARCLDGCLRHDRLRNRRMGCMPNDFRQPVQRHRIAFFEGVGMRRENFNYSDNAALGNHGSRDHCPDTQGLAAFAVHQRVDL